MVVGGEGEGLVCEKWGGERMGGVGNEVGEDGIGNMGVLVFW